MAKVGRNDPCPCGSGKKYKNCCLGKPKNHDGAFSAVVVDHEKKQLVLVKDNVLLNHLKRDTPPIE